MDKNKLRKDMIKKRLELDAHTFLLLNDTLLNKITSLKEFKDAKHIGIYVSYKNEVDTKNIMLKYFNNKIFSVPKVEGNDLVFYKINSLDDLEKGYFDVEEPKPIHKTNKDDIDLMIVPLLYFDKNKNRIGYGKGFYDRYLSDFKNKTIGIAYSFQEIENTFPHKLDKPLDMIITEIDII